MLVTGQVVKVVRTTSVVTTAWVEPGADGEGAVTGELLLTVEFPAEEAGVDVGEVGAMVPLVVDSGVLDGAMHFVQMVEVLVIKTVEMVVLTLVEVTLPDVTVLVTGQVVRVVRTTSVVTTAWVVPWEEEDVVEMLGEVVGTLGDTGAVLVEVGTVGTTGTVPGAVPVGRAGVVELTGVEYGTLEVFGELEEVATVLELLETGTLRAGGPQLKPTLWTPMSQPCWGASLGSLNVTDVAPPHCEFLISEPPLEQETVCLQVSPLG